MTHPYYPRYADGGGVLGSIGDAISNYGGSVADALNAIPQNLANTATSVGNFITHPVDSITQTLSNTADWANQQADLRQRAAQGDPDARAQLDQSYARAAGAFMPAGMFIGPSAALFDQAAASKAIDMAKAGAAPRDIWAATGTWKAPGGQLRQEIPDNTTSFISGAPAMAAKLDQYQQNYADMASQLASGKYPNQPDLFPTALKKAVTDLRSKMAQNKDVVERNQWLINRNQDLLANRSPGNGMAVGTADFSLEHPALYQAYPDLANMPVFQTERTNTGYNAMFDGDKITVTGSASDPTSSALHEMQHAVQDREGWAPGGNVGDMFDRLAQRRFETHQDAGLDPSAARAAVQQEAPTILQQAMQAYRNLGGEAEARATQARQNMDAATRRATFPEDSYDPDTPASGVTNRSGMLLRTTP